VEVLNPEVASLMITMMQSVVREGTGRVMIPNSGMGDRPCAGKTGTAAEYKDAWFIGYTPYIACGVWVGFDAEETKLPRPYHTGATAAIPIWGEFMKNASEHLGYPKSEFKLAGNITTVPICRESYQRATPFCPKDRVYTEYFIGGTEVYETCDVHGPERTQGIRDPRYRAPDRTSRRVR
jgi:penicillin-binding protein 1A